MYDTHKITLPIYAEKFFTAFLLLYPESYRRKYGQEMLLVFQDMFLEEQSKKGYVGIEFWFQQSADAMQSIVTQHLSIIMKNGFKKYLQKTLGMNTYNIIASFFLLPIFLVLFIDVISRVVQGDLTHYNRPVYTLLSHTFFYYTPVLFIWVILFPLVALLLTLFSLVKNNKLTKKTLFSRVFVQKNIWNLLMLSFILGFLALIVLHDFLPCTVHGIFRIGIQNLPQILAICRNA